MHVFFMTKSRLLFAFNFSFRDTDHLFIASNFIRINFYNTKKITTFISLLTLTTWLHQYKEIIIA